MDRINSTDIKEQKGAKLWQCLPRWMLILAVLLMGIKLTGELRFASSLFATHPQHAGGYLRAVWIQRILFIAPFLFAFALTKWWNNSLGERLSKLAVFAFVLTLMNQLLFGIVMNSLKLGLARGNDELISFFQAVAAFICGLVAWIRIHRRGPELTGRAFAILAMVGSGLIAGLWIWISFRLAGMARAFTGAP